MIEKREKNGRIINKIDCYFAIFQIPWLLKFQARRDLNIFRNSTILSFADSTIRNFMKQILVVLR